MAKIFLGSSTTNSQGKATFTYTGDGSGINNFVAESGNLVSQPYEVLDCIKYDNGTTTGTPNIWSTPTTSSTITITRDNEYCEFKEASSSNFANQVTGLTGSCVVEFDYWQLDGLSNTFMQIVKDGQQITAGGINLGMFNGSLENWYHLKLTFQNGIMTALNTTNGASFTKQLSDTPNAFNFWSSGDITTLRFKEFKVYPI